MAVSYPPWCETHLRSGNVVFVAPHGGRRPPVDPQAPPAALRVNDVYTPEVTRRLAAALDAGTIINVGQDRNTLDLNRIAPVRRRAPWFVALLGEHIERILTRHATAEVVFVHGWNVGQARCDVGVGATETETGLHVPPRAGLTVSTGYFATRIRHVQRECQRRGIEATVGFKYPASHPGNFLQAFSGVHLQSDDPGIRRLSEWAAAGRVQAWQLELGIPLRWPGPGQDALVAAVTDAFGTDSCEAAGDQPAAAIRRRHRVQEAALHLYDPAVDVGVLAGVGPMGPVSTGGRLLLFLGAGRLGLFTGEEPRWGRSSVPPLEMEAGAAGIALRYRGPLLVLDDIGGYLDLEAAFSRSRLAEADVRLEFAPRSVGPPGAGAFGRVEGHVALDGERRRIATGAFTNPRLLRPDEPVGQTSIAVDFGGSGGVLSRWVDGGRDAIALHFGDGAVRQLDGVRCSVLADGDACTPGRFEIRWPGRPPLHGRPRSRMAFLRPAAHGHQRVTLGVASFEWKGAVGWGLYEHAAAMAAPGRAATMRN
jgi:hypothetical protein